MENPRFGINFLQSMALKILKSEELLRARWNQPHMTRAEAAVQIRATMSTPQSDVRASFVKPKLSSGGLKRTTS